MRSVASSRSSRDRLPRKRGREALRIQLLGGFRVCVGSHPIAESSWRRRKAANLVKLLTLASEHRLHREEALELLWPDLSPQAAENNLHRTLHIVRHALEPDRPPGGQSPYLSLQDELLLLCPECALQLDVDDFTEAAETARRSQDPVRYEAAIDLYSGDLLPEDQYEDWAAGRREELRRLYHNLLRGQSRLYEGHAERRRAIEPLQRLVASDPADEEAHLALMRLYALLGQRSQALRQYEQLAEALGRELDAEPDLPTRQLYEEIRTERFPGEPPSMHGLTSAGAVRTTQPSSAETAASPPSTNLQRQLSSFVGREEEIAELRNLLSTTSLLTLTGAGGVGKSRLALHLAAQVVDEYPDGVWLVQLAALADPQLVPASVASVLGVRESSGRALVDTLVDFLRSRQLLLVLDNCEHLLDACAGLSEALLSACPAVRVMATSRQALRLPGETAWRVPSLSMPDPQRLPPLDQLPRHDAVALFLERTRNSRPDFVLNTQNATAVVEVCRRLDGIPVALELAAARMKLLTVEQLAGRLDDCFAVLGGGSTSTLSRHRTLRVTMDWSHGLLNETERMLFRRLAVFAGGWTLEAVEGVCSASGIEEREVLDLLSELVDQSLVIVFEQGAAMRYRLLEPVRQYALERLRSAGEEEQVRRRHAEWYLNLAETAEPYLTGPEQTAWLGRLEVEHDNLRVALRYSLDGGEAAIALRLAGALWRFWWMHAHLSEGRRWLEQAVATDATSPAHPRAKALRGAGAIAVNQGDSAGAAGLLERGLALYRELQDRAGIADTLINLGNVANSESDYGRASSLYQEALALSRELGEPTRIVRVLNNLGLAAFYHGDYESAAQLFEEALALARETGDTDNIARALANLGSAVLEQGDPDRAIALQKEALTLFHQVGNRYSTAWCLEGLARAAAVQGKARCAARLWGAVESLYAVIGSALLPMERPLRERYAASARARLGEVAFRASWEEGRAMLLEQVIADALSAATSVGDAALEASSSLTSREREIAALMAEGLANREIAAQLGVSRSTVEAHVHRILKKMGLASRAEVSAHAAHDSILSQHPS